MHRWTRRYPLRDGGRKLCGLTLGSRLCMYLYSNIITFDKHVYTGTWTKPKANVRDRDLGS